MGPLRSQQSETQPPVKVKPGPRAPVPIPSPRPSRPLSPVLARVRELEVESSDQARRTGPLAQVSQVARPMLPAPAPSTPLPFASKVVEVSRALVPAPPEVEELVRERLAAVPPGTLAPVVEIASGENAGGVRTGQAPQPAAVVVPPSEPSGGRSVWPLVAGGAGAALALGGLVWWLGGRG